MNALPTVRLGLLPTSTTMDSAPRSALDLLRRDATYTGMLRRSRSISRLLSGIGAGFHSAAWVYAFFTREFGGEFLVKVVAAVGGRPAGPRIRRARRVRGLRLGSVSQECVAHAKCQVVIVRPKEG